MDFFTITAWTCITIVGVQAIAMVAVMTARMCTVALGKSIQAKRGNVVFQRALAQSVVDEATKLAAREAKKKG